jgi:hypothetical protein
MLVAEEDEGCGWVIAGEILLSFQKIYIRKHPNIIHVNQMW